MRVIRGAIGWSVAAGAWAVHLAIYPAVLAYTVALAPGAQALQAFLDEEAEAFSHSFTDQMALARRQAERKAS